MNDSASALFDRIERDHIRPLLKGRGFRKRALTFSRARDGLTDVVSLQRSTGNTAGHVRFYVNCGVYSSEFSSVFGQTIIGRPREVDCQFRCRMETLAPAAPPWFEITQETDAQHLGTVVVGALDEAVGALDAIETTDELVDRISRGVAIEAFRYRVATEDWGRAREIYQSMRAEFGSEDRWPRIDDNLKRHVPPAELVRVCAVMWTG